MIPLQLTLAPEWAPDRDAPWRTLEARPATTFVAVPPGAVLNPPASTGMGFWSINPYVGCEFGCTYCYARDTHRYAVERAAASGRLADTTYEEFGGLEGWEAFERRILVKEGAELVLDGTLARAARRGRLAGRPIVIGTATDPYQPAERRFGLTRRILETLARHRGSALSIAVITKSPLVTRDLALLQQLSERHDVSVNVSLATLDTLLLRKLEPRSPAPRARLRALAQLSAAGIETGLFIAPIIPKLTDGRRDLFRLVEAARGAGAKYVMGSTLRLGPAARRRFLPHLEHVFPELADRYRRHYARGAGAAAAYQDAVADRLAEAQIAAGFAPRARRRHAKDTAAAASTAATAAQAAMGAAVDAAVDADSQGTLL